MRKWWLRRGMKVSVKTTWSMRRFMLALDGWVALGAVYHMRWGLCVMGPFSAGVRYVPDTLSHEFLHHWLNRNIGQKASLALDNIDCLAERVVR